MNRYDLVCNIEFSLSEDRFSRLMLVDPVFKSLERALKTDGKGLFCLGLPLLECLWAGKVLKRHKIDSFPVPVEYACATVSKDDAREVAKLYLKRVEDQNRRFFEKNLIEARLSPALSRMTYGFICQPVKSEAECRLPGGLTICVDKVSAQVWEEVDFTQLDLMKWLICE
ncbi:hypothetical protein [Roseateles depolymerans]|uniref:hypothetical protein n=1 Tax=Roseateles depolymerans TaxID=76731 RepID=UPI0011C023C6|nr:hypothetical protein [Roseateles depolymerans]